MWRWRQTDIGDGECRGSSCSARRPVVPAAFQQRRDHRLGLASRGRCDDQRVVSGQDGRDRLLLNRRQTSVAGEEGGPGVGKVVSWSERFHDKFFFARAGVRQQVLPYQWCACHS